MDPKYFEIRDGFPAVNVKVGNWAQETPENPRLIPYIEEAAHYAPQLFDSAFARIAELWWEERVKEIAQEWGLEVALINQDGRSGGWLVYRDRGLTDDLHRAAQDEVASLISQVAQWVGFVDAVEGSVANAAEDMRHEVAWLYAELLNERRDRLIEEWDRAHPRLTTRSAMDDPAFGYSRPADAACGVCDGWGWVGHDELVPCPKCERGANYQRPRLGIDVPSPKYELHDVGTEANPYLNVPTVHDWALKKWMEGGNDDVE